LRWEIQHLEAAGGATMNLDVLERVGAALNARADRLRQQAASRRVSALVSAVDLRTLPAP